MLKIIITLKLKYLFFIEIFSMKIVIIYCNKFEIFYTVQIWFYFVILIDINIYFSVQESTLNADEKRFNLKWK